MTQGISLGALARELGRAKSGLHKLAKRQQIPQNGDGTFDLAAVREALGANLDPAKAKGVHRSPVNAVVNEEDAREAISLIRRVLQQEGVSSDGDVDFAMARTAETILKARSRDLDMQVKSGRLVDAETVRKTVFNMARAERDALMNWPARVAPLIAAGIGADQVALAVALERHVREFLLERSEPELRLAG